MIKMFSRKLESVFIRSLRHFTSRSQHWKVKEPSLKKREGQMNIKLNKA